MDRDFYLALAHHGLRMPIGTPLVLHEEREPEKVRRDGPALGRVIERAARRWGTPLAVPLMDLRLEKIDLLALAGIPENEAETFHFPAPVDQATLARLCGEEDMPLGAGSVARDQALAYIGSHTDLVPVGMAIGPYSLATRLIADPIAATVFTGSGMTAEDSSEVMLLGQCLRMAEAAVLRSVRSQIRNGARAVMICEPAACKAFLSPRQIKAGSDVFERVVMEPNLRIKRALGEAGCDLIFHDCGELIDFMVESFARRLHPVILSLGSSRRLWEDARLVPRDVVLYGNLPTRSFYSDSAMPIEAVIRLTEELIANMKACGHRQILGSECDVLFVPEAQDAIRKKVEAMMHAGTADSASLAHATHKAGVLEGARPGER